jgi:hypothetical protein
VVETETEPVAEAPVAQAEPVAETAQAPQAEPVEQDAPPEPVEVAA